MMVDIFFNISSRGGNLLTEQLSKLKCNDKIGFFGEQSISVTNCFVRSKTAIA